MCEDKAPCPAPEFGVPDLSIECEYCGEAAEVRLTASSLEDDTVLDETFMRRSCAANDGFMVGDDNAVPTGARAE
jgi:hypothetical protein